MAWRPTGATLFIEKTVAPTVNDDQNEGYLVGDIWIDETNDKSYVCLDVTVGAAVWTEITGGGAAYTHPNHSGEVTSLGDGAQTIANKETLSATAPITLSNTPTVIAAAAPVIAIPAATNAIPGHATAAHIGAIEASTNAQHTQGTDTTLGTQAENLDLGGFRAVNAGDATDPLDLVNLVTMLNTYGVVMNFWLMATSLLSNNLTISVTTGTQVISASAELTSANTFFKSTLANTPTPFVVKNGTIIPVHIQALVSDTSGYKEVSLHAELWRVDSNGSGNPAQIGADSASTDLLTTDKTLYELHIHVPTETVVAAGSRLWVRLWATVGAGTLNPTVTIYSGSVHDHISIAVSGSVLGRYLQLAGGTMSGAIAMGANKVTGLAAPTVNGDAVRATAKITEALLESATDLKHTQGSDVALGAVGTKNPPIDADKALYRDSTSADALVTSTWTQVKAFLKTYFDGLYQPVGTGFASKARGYRATSQNIPQTTWTKVQLDNESFDGLGEFDPVTNYRFTASAAGYYLVFGQVSSAYAVADAARYVTRIYKNGAMEISSDKSMGLLAYTAQSVSGIVYLAATEYLELWFYHTDAANNIVNASGDTFMTVHRIS